ncbi:MULTISPECIES: NAD(P)-dependent oxidoreductase [Vibrio]|uniref:NAD(P)-dependent oxidoreductase n=1 Tax=Vibrio TaxID=662 RepID=UPI001EFECF06|nr:MULTISPECIES: NAD(P)-dependent oxidoreductase [Vibrio]MCF4173902.1 hypothetical protein [Vibrio sp. McD22-P3]MCG9626394.1 hypothetical protein [Vibrio mediterranei]MCG9656935.1 hypothetical protein [Vibrio mediterranei]MCG9663755.1 hypothetical protein [Vibrio mediterranei]
MKVYVHPLLNEREREYFITHSATELAFTFNDGTCTLKHCRDADIAIGNFNTSWIEEMTNLKAILLDSVGTDNFNGYQWSKGNTVMVCNLADFFTIPVAEEVLASLLSVYRLHSELYGAQQNNCWAKDTIRFKKRLLSDASVLIIGFGNIGRRIASLLAPFGCEVQTFDNQDMEVGGIAALTSAVSLNDVIISTIPATTETLDIFDEKMFAAMRSGATFLNVGRGQVVDEVALCQKAKNDKTFSACLDVTVQEPIPDNSLLWKLPNIYLTQHTGGGSIDENYKKIDIYISQIHRLLNDQPLNNMIQF